MKYRTKLGARVGLGIVLAGVCIGADAATLGTYTFSTANEVPTTANGTFMPFSVSGTGLQASIVNGAFETRGWPATQLPQPPTQFIEFTLTPASGYYLSMENITFQAWHKQSAAVTAEIFQGIGPGLTTKGTTQWTTLGTSQTGSLDFNFGDFQTANGQGITVRFYGWNAQNSQDFLYFDNVTINGSVNPVPEPVNRALMAFGLCLVGGVVAQRRLKGRQRFLAWLRLCQ